MIKTHNLKLSGTPSKSTCEDPEIDITVKWSAYKQDEHQIDDNWVQNLSGELEELFDSCLSGQCSVVQSRDLTSHCAICLQLWLDQHSARYRKSYQIKLYDIFPSSLGPTN